MVAPAPEKDDYLPSAEQLGREDSDSRESYAVNNEPAISTVEDGVSEVDLEVILRVAYIMEDMTGKCFPNGETRVSHVQPKSFFKPARGICGVQKDRTGPQHIITQHLEVQQPEQRLAKRVEPDQHMIDLTKTDDPPQTPSVQWVGTFGKREAGNQPTQAPPVKLRRKQNAIPPRMLNADPRTQFIGTDTILKPSLMMSLPRFYWAQALQ